VRKTLVLMLFLGLVTAGAWAQTDTLLGPHNTNNTFGCQSCHAPHSQVLPGQGLYMWGLSVPTTGYQTYGSGTSLGITTVLTSGMTLSDTTPHTILCLSCHDQTFNTVMGGTCAGAAGAPCYGQTSPTTNMGTPITNMGAPGTHGFGGAGDGMFTSVGGGVATSAGNISSNHPVHVQYPNIMGAAQTGYTAETADTYWALATPATITPGTWNDTQTGAFHDTGTVFTYGHPARIFLDPGALAWIECGSCHDPHSQTTAVVTVGTTNSTVATAHFLRGEYDTVQTQTAFCMSCHADKSLAWNGSGTQ